MYRKWLELEILKGNMQIEALILNEGRLFQKIDGIEVIKIDEILVREYDYLINMNQKESQTVLRILELLKVLGEKVIPVKIFGQPFFDLERWVKVKESNISSISNNCWGDFEHYISLEPRLVRMGYEEVLQREYPIIGLGDVELYFNHYINFEDAVTTWSWRKSRINYDNLFVEMIIDSYEDMDDFLKLPYKRKIGFTALPCDEKDIISFSDVNSVYLENKYSGNFWNFINHMAMLKSDECRQYNILKLLNGEADFMRTVK